MTVFCYDKTLEGLLTAVFDAYFRKSFPDRLAGVDEPMPLFVDNTHSVVSDSVKAQRVWKALGKKVSKGVCDMIMHVWLSELPSSDELIFRYIRKIFDSASEIASNFADDDILTARKIATKVSRERLHVIQFVRFQKAADGIYFAPVAPLYNVLPLTISHFCDRFADQMWLIYDLKRHYGYYYNLETATEVTLDNDEHLLDGKLTDDAMVADEKAFQSMWREYTKSLTIRERINPRLQRQHMPQRFWKYLPEKN